jgi:hypothetical protein
MFQCLHATNVIQILRRNLRNNIIFQNPKICQAQYAKSPNCDYPTADLNFLTAQQIFTKYGTGLSDIKLLCEFHLFCTGQL